MKQKLIVECTLPKDYCLSNLFHVVGMPYLPSVDFYAITQDKKLVKKILAEEGFSFDTIPCDTDAEFDITQTFVSGMGIWESKFHVSVSKGDVKNIYEVSTELIDGKED